MGFNNHLEQEPIDFVVLWVDDQDEKWIKKKKKYEKKYNIENKNPERFRNWDNLHYLFRAIEKNAPWVNHVYLVTDKQKPEWLNTRNTNLTVIDHAEIIDAKYLPTFNSRTIELNLHNIPGLSENFVYFNDDMFLIDEVKPIDFFENNLPKILGVLDLITPIQNDNHRATIYNNMTLINANFNKRKTLHEAPFKWLNLHYGMNVIRTILLWIWPSFSSFLEPHVCSSFKKSTYETVWKKCSSELEKASSYKFRNSSGYNQYLFKNWQLASNNFIPQNRNFGKVFHLDENMETTKECVNHINKGLTKVVCVNDTENIENFHLHRSLINQAFFEKYPEKSTYEL